MRDRNHPQMLGPRVMRSRSLRGEKAEDLAHHALSLIRLEEILSVRRAIKNDQLFGFGSFLVLFANPGETRPIVACIISCHNE
jgi:hypothetical protein